MKRTICLALAALVLAGCAAAPKESGADAFAAADAPLTSVDAAYEAEYTKFTLPPRSALHLVEPEGVYRVTLGVVNYSEDKELEAKWSRELRPIFCNDDDSSGEVCAVVSGAYYINESRIAESVTPMSPTPPSASETIILSPQSLARLDDKAAEAVSRCESLAASSREVFGEELTARASEITIYRSGDRLSYGVELEKCYKGLGLMHHYPLHPTSEQSGGKSSLRIWQSFAEFDGSAELTFYSAGPSFTAKRAERLETVLSFKSACDRLENALAPRAHYEFDDVLLMYDTRADDSGGDLADIECMPKWFFVQYSTDSPELMLRYFSVDCVSGEIEAVW